MRAQNGRRHACTLNWNIVYWRAFLPIAVQYEAQYPRLPFRGVTYIYTTYSSMTQSQKIGQSMYISDLGTRSFFPDLLSAHFISMDRYSSFCRFSGSLIAQSLSKTPVVRSRKRALKRKIAPKTTAVRSYVCIGTYICT